MRRPLALIVLCATLALPVPAEAATTLGQLDPAAAPSGSCAGDSSWAQDANTGSGSYIVPAGGGVLTAWSHKANAATGRQLALRVWRPTGTPTSYVLVGGGGYQTLSASTVNTFATGVSVQAGDRIGVRVGNPGFPVGGGASCVFSAALGNTVNAALLTAEPAAGGTMLLSLPFTSSRVNLTAKLEADADQDGFGDETQDACPTKPGSCSGAGGTPGQPGSGAQPGKDTIAPRAKVRARAQAVKGGKVKITVTPSEDVTVVVMARVSQPGAAKIHRLRTVTRAGRANKRLVVRLRVGKAVRKALRPALRRGKRPRVRITVRLEDIAGNKGTAKTTLRLKRR